MHIQFKGEVCLEIQFNKENHHSTFTPASYKLYKEQSQKFTDRHLSDVCVTCELNFLLST